MIDNDSTVFSRLMKIHDLHNNSFTLLLNVPINKIRNDANNAFHTWHKRGYDIALNKYIEDSIKYIDYLHF